MSITPNMDLTLPTPETTTGPAYATQINTALEAVDAHDHSDGKGPRVTQDGFAPTGDVDFRNFGATSVSKVALKDMNGSEPTSVGIYRDGHELVYRDGQNNAVQLTSNGSPVGAAGNITGMTGTNATVDFTSASGTFAFESDTGVPGLVQGGDVRIIEPTAGKTNAVVMASPTSLAAEYRVVWPAAKPSSGTKFLRFNSSNNVTCNVDADGSTLEVSGNDLRVMDAGIVAAKLASNAVTAAKIASDAVTTAKILDGNVTQVKLGEAVSGLGSLVNVTVAQTGSYADVSGFAVTHIVTSDLRPVLVSVDCSSAVGAPSVQVNTGTNRTVRVRILANGAGFSDSLVFNCLLRSENVNSYVPPSSFAAVFPMTGATVGQNVVFRVQAYKDNAADVLVFDNVKLRATEL